MIIIRKNTTNIIALTVTEKVTLTNPYFLFKFTNDLTKTTKLFLAANISDYTDRYDKFYIEESTTENLLLSKVTLSPTGGWSYQVFEQASSTNLLQSATGAMVESGKVKVIGTDTIKAAHNPTQKTYKAYGTGA